MDAALTPREIQARIRAGETVSELAAKSGMDEASIEPFAGPVLAERAFVAGQATRGQVRRAGVAGQQTLAEMIGDRLASRGLSSSDVEWDAWRGADRLWTLRASYMSGSAPHEGVFRYDPAGRFSVAVNDEARWLVGEQSSARGPQPGRKRDNDAEPTVDLGRRRRAQPVIDFEPDDYSPAQLTEIDGVYDLVPTNQAGMDVLYDMLASFNEDSVRIYEGLTGVVRTPDGAEASDPERNEATTRTTMRRTKTAGASPVIELPTAPAPAPGQDEAKEPTQRIPKSKKRAVVPTWDEIMFGSPQA